MYKVIRNFLGEQELEGVYQTKQEAQAYINKAKQQDIQLNMPFESTFRIEKSVDTK